MPAISQWIDPLNDPRWPKLLERHSCASIFQSPGWLEALQRTYGYKPLALTIGTPGGEFTSGVVFCHVESWLTGRRLVSLPFSDYCDPLVAGEDEQELLMDALKKYSERWKYVELRPRSAWSGPCHGFVGAERYVLHRLDLRVGVESLLRGFHKNHVLRKIRRAEREGLVYEEGRSEALLQAFYKLLIKTRRRHALPPQPVRWFRAIFDCLPGQAKIRVALKDGTPVASVMTLSARNSMIYKYGASDAKVHRFGGMQLLLWKTIQDACERGCATLDLGRSRIDNIGEVAFKDHWGATRNPLVYWRFPARGPAGNLEQLCSRASHVFSFLPDRLLVAAGTFLYPHIG